MAIFEKVGFTPQAFPPQAIDLGFEILTHARHNYDLACSKKSELYLKSLRRNSQTHKCGNFEKIPAEGLFLLFPSITSGIK